MNEQTNILILSCGSRNKIVQYFKKELGNRGKILATDSSRLAPALYEADSHYIVPRVDEENYLDVILNICIENDVKGVLSLIDPELSLLAKNKEKFFEIGVTPIVSAYSSVEMCFDKYQFYQFVVENELNSIKSYIDKELFYQDIEKSIINYPVFVKPIKGSASININKVNSKEEIDALFERYDNLMIQEFMGGKEFGADVYIDMISNEASAIFVKEKLKMRAGETDKSISVNDEHIFSVIKEFIRKTDFNGIIDIDIFKNGDRYYISEVNPRFGGGYPHAYECGVNVPKMIINNLNGVQNPVTIGEYRPDILMMKYSDLIVKGEQ